MFYPLFFFSYIIFFIVLQQNFTNKTKTTFGVLFFLAFSLIVIATLRPKTLPDYANYKIFYDYMGEDRFEITAKVYRYISPSFLFFLLIYAATSILLKMYAIKTNSEYVLLSVITYLSTSFLLHDMIQIRVSCAIGLFLISIKYLHEHKWLKYYFLILIACFFHITAAVFFILPLFASYKFNPFIWCVFILFSYAIYFLHIDFLSICSSFLPKGSYYFITLINHADYEGLNVFNVNQILRILIFLILTFNSKKLDSLQIISLKIFAISIIILPLFSSLSVIGFRISEMVGTIVIFVLPNIVSVFKKKQVGLLLFYIFICMFFYLNNIHTFFAW